MRNVRPRDKVQPEQILRFGGVAGAARPQVSEAVAHLGGGEPALQSRGRRLGAGSPGAEGRAGRSVVTMEPPRTIVTAAAADSAARCTSWSSIPHAAARSGRRAPA